MLQPATIRRLELVAMFVMMMTDAYEENKTTEQYTSYLDTIALAADLIRMPVPAMEAWVSVIRTEYDDSEKRDIQLANCMTQWLSKVWEEIEVEKNDPVRSNILGQYFKRKNDRKDQEDPPESD